MSDARSRRLDGWNQDEDENLLGLELGRRRDATAVCDYTLARGRRIERTRGLLDDEKIASPSRDEIDDSTRSLEETLGRRQRAFDDAHFFD